MANQIVIDRYFAALKATPLEIGIFDKPSYIYNCDETAVDMGQRLGKVVVPCGAKNAYSEQRGPRDHITAHICCSAAGQILPMIIFEKCWPSAPYVKHGADGAFYAKSPNGYIDEELLLEWFKKIFLQHTTSYRPCVLITDGHGSHITN